MLEVLAAIAVAVGLTVGTSDVLNTYEPVTDTEVGCVEDCLDTVDDLSVDCWNTY